MGAKLKKVVVIAVAANKTITFITHRLRTTQADYQLVV